LIQIGFWNEKGELQFPYAMVGVTRGLHIIKDEKEAADWYRIPDEEGFEN
jgi:hypothetical protein